MRISHTPRRIACRAATPLGVFTALYEDGVIRRVLFPEEPYNYSHSGYDDTLPFASQMDEYFNGSRQEFDLPMLLPGTPFRQAVYAAVLRISYGRTATYADVALSAGYPLAMRAVGTAMKINPLPVLIPCHRVVHKAPFRRAYRGGLSVKDALLALESKYKRN